MTENARKVFDMLGVEPNEEFEMLLDTCKFSFKCKIDAKLQGYYFDGEDWIFFGELLKDLLNGANTIVKLPKAKYFGDLQCEDVDCKDCPLYAIHCFPQTDTLYDELEKWLEVYKDQELYEILKARLDKEVE